jgi:hypothetical protein
MITSHRMKLHPGYPSLGKCIYCLVEFPKSELTDEHIVPLALNGAHIIRKAACKKCQDDFNKHFENVALQNDFLVPRLVFNLKRRKKKTPKHLPPVAINHPRDVLTTPVEALNVTLPSDQYPSHLTFILWDRPGKLCGLDRGGGFRYFRAAIVPVANSPMPGRKVTMRTRRHHTSFCTTLAKIAYCHAVGEMGLDGFDGDEIRDLLAGRRSDVFNFVGNNAGSKPQKSRFIHELRIRTEGEWILVLVQLFASYGSPIYEVVVGQQGTPRYV